MNSGLYAFAGDTATATAAACAKRLEEPMTNVSKVYLGLSRFPVWVGGAVLPRRSARPVPSPPRPPGPEAPAPRPPGPAARPPGSSAPVPSPPAASAAGPPPRTGPTALLDGAVQAAGSAGAAGTSKSASVPSRVAGAAADPPAPPPA